jgi:hypothetical protein
VAIPALPYRLPPGTNNGRFVHYRYKALTPSKLYVLDLEQIQDLQLECAELRDVIKRKRMAQIVGNNVKHVISTMRQAMWYSFGVATLATATLITAVAIVVS